MELKVILTTAATGLAASTSVSADMLKDAVTEGYDIWALYNADQSSVYSDIAYENGSYLFNPAAVYEQLSKTVEPETPSSPLTNAIDVADMVAKIREIFGLNGVQVAQAVRISRPSLYNHLKGMDCDQSIDRYRELYSLANKIESQVETRIKRGLKSVLVDGKTLLSYLKEDTLNHDKILEVSILIAEKLAGAPNVSSEKISAKDQIRSSRSVSKFS